MPKMVFIEQSTKQEWFYFCPVITWIYIYISAVQITV